MFPAAFLDRDGVINKDHGYIAHWNDFDVIDGVENALHALQGNGFKLIVITNQSGIGRGFFSEDAFQVLNAKMTDYFANEGIQIDGVYHCPHHPTDAKGEFLKNCGCRKPAPGMILAACEAHGIAPEASIMVGDKPSDMSAGKAAGVRRLFHVTTDSPHSDAEQVSSLADLVARFNPKPDMINY